MLPGLRFKGLNQALRTSQACCPISCCPLIFLRATQFEIRDQSKLNSSAIICVGMFQFITLKILANLVLQECVSFSRFIRKGNSRRCWQFPISFYRRVSRFCSVSGKVAHFFSPCSHENAIANFRGCQKGGFPKGWFWRMSPGTRTGTRVHSDVSLERKQERGYVRMFPRNENRNEGTFAKTTLLENHPFGNPRNIFELCVFRFHMTCYPNHINITFFPNPFWTSLGMLWFWQMARFRQIAQSG